MRIAPLVLAAVLAALPAAAQPTTFTLAYTLTSPNPVPTYNLFGNAVAVADLNGDGAAEVVVGAACEGNPDTVYPTGCWGRVHVFDGATRTVLFTVHSPMEPVPSWMNLWFGQHVAVVGDQNGDGVPDILVGAAAEDDIRGHAYLFSGAGGALLHAFASPNELQAGNFGHGVTDAGDLDGDGVHELYVGAFGEHPVVGQTVQNLGRAYLMHGGTYEVFRVLESPDPTHAWFFGWDGAAVGDLTGDGVTDLVVGDPRWHSVGDYYNPTGAVHAFNGATGAALYTAFSPNGPSYEGMFGQSVTALGDLTGDGVPDVAVGAPGDDESGRAYFLSGVDGVGQAALASTNPHDPGWFGAEVATADFNLDGLQDVLTGAPLEEVPPGTPNRTGNAYIHSGATAFPIAYFPPPSPTGDGRFGWSVAAGDVNGHGVPDAVIGAQGNHTVYIYSADAATTGTSGPAPATAALAVAPNPAAADVRVTLALREAGDVRVALYDVLGREVAVLHDGALAAGTHALALDARRLPAGAYVVRAEDAAVRLARRLTVAR